LPADGPVVGLAGTVSTLAALQHGVTRYERALLHHVVLSSADVAHWLEVLSGEDSAARLARPGMVEGRQDVIVGGVLVLHCVMDEFARAVCLVSEDDILDGLAASLRRATAAADDLGNPGAVGGVG
jgi:exopolyphosphatase/guanosine-5'-triphosphate,3'-diphosphate pyrophosphatase